MTYLPPAAMVLGSTVVVLGVLLGWRLWAAPRLRPGRRDARVRRRELRYTGYTLGMGMLAGGGMTGLAMHGLVPISLALPDAPTLVFEAAAFVFAFDLYFYALHRLLHTRLLWPIHALHHRSPAPGILTALAFHPLEAALIILFTPAALVLVPLHLASVAVASAFLSATLVLAHCGRDPFPAWWQRVPVLDWYVTPGVHERHHREPDCNYGATLAIFDRLCGTLRGV